MSHDHDHDPATDLIYEPVHPGTVLMGEFEGDRRGVGIVLTSDASEEPLALYLSLPDAIDLANQLVQLLQPLLDASLEYLAERN